MLFPRELCGDCFLLALLVKMALQGCALARLGVPVAHFSTSFLPLPPALPPSRSQLVVCCSRGGGGWLRNSALLIGSGNGGGLLLSRGHHCFPALWFSFAGSCFLPLGSGFDLPDLVVIFFLRLDMFPSVSAYKVKGTCFLKPKVRGLAVAWPLSVCGGLPASACLDSRPSRGQDVCPNLPRGC